MQYKPAQWKELRKKYRPFSSGIVYTIVYTQIEADELMNFGFKLISTDNDDSRTKYTLRSYNGNKSPKDDDLDWLT